MNVVPVSVGEASRAWDEQHLDLQAAGEQIGEAPTSGFTPAVAGAAARFVSGWARHTTGLAEEAEAQADGLRTALSDYLATDEAQADVFETLGQRMYVEEVR